MQTQQNKLIWGWEIFRLNEKVKSKREGVNGEREQGGREKLHLHNLHQNLEKA